MSRLHTLKTITASATLLFAFSLSFASLAGAAPQKVAAPAKVAAHRARVSPPHAGVKLLEDILSRMRNLPMIAMARNKQTFQYQQASQNAAPAQGATDQLLAIRPKESSYKMNAGKRKSTIAMAEPRASFGSSRIAGNSYAKYDDARSTQANEGTMRRAQSQPGDYKDSDSSPSNLLAKKRSNMSQMPSSLPSSGMGAYVPNAYQASNKGIQNFDTATREITERLSPEARQRLTSSTGKLFDVARKLEEAQQLAQNIGRQSAPGGGGGNAGGYQGSPGRSPVVADERHAPAGSFRNESKASKVISTNPLITEYDKGSASGSQVADEETSSSDYFKPAEKEEKKPQTIARATPLPAPSPMAMSLSQSESNIASPQKPPAQASLFKHVREFLNNRDGINATNTKAQQDLAGLDKSKAIEIALLPPSVVTGIPLVRLGTSEQETNKALSGKGAINKTKVNDWSVWSLQKPGNDEVSLQIYTKNGQVQAIRIFDSSLISPDFGVKLGDELGTVKQKFGEPSFILSEPQSRGGQNYVYPISQVSFQLAYTSKTTAPRVVSLLIFNAN